MSSDPEDICSNPPRNADMDGITIAVTNVVVHLCLRIVVTYSDEDIGLEIQSLLVQFYPILLSTLLSIKRQQLSLLDVYFALLVSVSPLAVYLSFASFCNLFGTRTGLFNRIESNGFVISAFGAFVPFLWIALSMVTGFSSSAFEDSACYPTQTFLEWLKATVLYLISGFLSYGGASLSALALFLPFLILLFRRRSQVWADVKLSEAPKWRVPFTWVKYAWCTISRQHKWCIHLVFASIDAIWSLWVIFNAIAPKGEYVLSYGQLLPIFCTFPTIASTIKFIHSLGLKSLFQLLTEHGFKAEVRYLFTGKEPDHIQDSHPPSNVILHPDEPTVSSSDLSVGSVPSRTGQPPRPHHSPESDHVDGSRIGAATPVNTVCDGT